MSKNIPRIVHLNETDFRDAMLNLRQRGNAHQRAYNEAARIISSLSYGADEVNKMTKWGESRIKGCFKYDISNDHHRLVTVHSDNFIYLLFVGTHDETERWLDRHRGLTISCNPESLKVTVTHVTHEARREMPGLDYNKLREENTPYFERLTGLDLTELIPLRPLVRELKRVDDTTGDDEIQELASDLTDFDPVIANLILDLIFELREGRIEAANARVEHFRQQAIPIQDNAEMEERALQNNVNSDRAVLLTGLSEEQLKEMFSPEKFQEWMLFLHPDQKRIAENDYDRPVVLTGVSGSGKTCVLVHRARNLARKYPNERIGVLTLNRNLSHLIQNLVTELCSPEEQANIHVLAFYDYFKQLVEHFGPDEYLTQLSRLAESHDHRESIQAVIARVDRARFAREYDAISKESLDDAWDMFIDQDHVSDDLSFFAKYLRNYQPSIAPDSYLREELSLIRSAVATSLRDPDYIKMLRNGRAFGFPKKIRRITLNLLLLWEETMLHGGLLDDLSLTLALLPSRTKLDALPASMRFRCLLIDEFQDLSTLDLVLLSLIPTQTENGLFVAGDTVQRVLVKSLKLLSVGLDVTSARWERITKNYRNSRQILKAASNLANMYGDKAKNLGEEIELLDPEFAVRETGKPQAVKVPPEREITEAWRLARDCIQNQAAIPWSVCLLTASPEKISVSKILEVMPTDFPVKANRITGEYTRTKDTMCVGAIAEAKGFEFCMVIIVGCGDEFLPNPSACREEGWREALRLYVAMTRGRDSVVLLYSGNPSEFVLAMKDDLNWENSSTPFGNERAHALGPA